MGAWGKANINLRIDNNFCYFLKYLCSPEKGCFLYTLLLLFDASDLCLESWLLKLFCKVLVSILVVDSRICLFQTLIFFGILYYFCHSRQLPWWSVFCCYLLLYRLGKSISFSRFKLKNCKPSHQITLKFCIFKIKSAEI
jgi:hypothetical protein